MSKEPPEAGVLMVASLVSLVVSEATQGSRSTASMVVVVVALVVSTVLIVGAMCIPSGICVRCG